MFDFLRSISLTPIEWTQAIELTGSGSPYIGDVLDAAFNHASAVVVLMTPDEVAYLQSAHSNGPDDPETEPATQARPNVLFEAGMAMGRDAGRTVLVEIGTVRPFSDVAGRHAVRLTNSVHSRQDLANRLRNAGCDVDLSGTDWHSSGDFTHPASPGGGLPLGRRVPSQAASRPPIDIDLKYFSKGGNRLDKLQVINRGTETAFNVTLELPEDPGFSFTEGNTVDKIPGGGKSVTVDVLSNRRSSGSRSKSSAFDVIVRSTRSDGEVVTQEVFVDMNG